MAGYIGSKTVNLSTTGADIDGNITISGNVDGRDVAALGTKLDTVEANAKDDQTAAEIRALVAAASDSNVFTDADHSKLNGLEATGDVTDATNVAAAGALMRSGGAMTGAITTNSTFDGVDIATRDAVLTSTTTTANAALPKAGGDVTGLLKLSSIDPILRFNDTNGGTDTKNFEMRYVGTSSPDIDGLYFRTANDALNSYSDKMVILGSGNVGIGTSAPVADFVVSNGGAAGIELQPEIATDTNRITNYDRAANAYMNFRLDALTHQFLTSGAERMRITSAGLHQFKGELETVNATMVMRFRDASENFKAGIQAVNSNGQMVGSSAAGDFAIRSQSNMLFSTGGNTERMRINSSGNVGIGTTSINANAKLHVQDSDGSYPDNANNHLVVESSSHSYIGLGGGTNSDVGIHMGDSGGIGRGRLAYLNASDAMVFSTNNTERVRIDSSGNVGIGNTNPDLPLTVTSNSGANALSLRARSNDDYTFLQFYNHAGSALRGQIYNHAGALGFSTSSSGTERLRISTAGIVTKPYQPSFHVVKNADQNNIATATAVTVLWQVESYDVGGNFASNTFTAPVTGKYILTASIRVDSSDTASNHDDMAIVTSNRLYKSIIDLGRLSGDPVYWTHTINAVADMDAGDTAFVTFFQTGGTAQADIKNDSGRTYFSGILVG